MEHTTFTTDPMKRRNWSVYGDTSSILDALYQRVEQLEEENAALKQELAQLKRPTDTNKGELDGSSRSS